MDAPIKKITLGDAIISDKEKMTAEVEYKDGIFLTLQFISRNTLNSISRTCVVQKYNEVTKSRQPQIDSDRFAESFCRRAVVGWRGVTLRKLARLIPLDLKRFPVEDHDAERPFEIADLITVVKNAYELDNFLQDTAVDLKIFRPDLEAELKNSQPSQSIT